LKFLLQTTSLLFTIFVVGALFAFGQTDPFFRGDPRREEEAKVIKEMLAKQQSERDKKEHEELLKRADTALEISDELEKAFEDDGHRLTPSEEKKLAELEKVVKKIRDDLGGDDEEPDAEKPDSGPKDVKDAFLALRKSTLQLVDEVKKTTRFSISAIAVESSNTVLRLVRFLRFRD